MRTFGTMPMVLATGWLIVRASSVKPISSSTTLKRGLICHVGCELAC